MTTTPAEQDNLSDFRKRLEAAFAEQTAWSAADREQHRHLPHVAPEISWEELAEVITDERQAAGQ
jgi:hypothetical protein